MSRLTPSLPTALEGVEGMILLTSLSDTATKEKGEISTLDSDSLDRLESLVKSHHRVVRGSKYCLYTKLKMDYQKY